MKITTKTNVLSEGITIIETYVTHSEWGKDILEGLFSVSCFAFFVGVAASLNSAFAVLWTCGYLWVSLFFPSALHFRLFTRKQDWSRWEATNSHGVVLLYTDSWGTRWVHPEVQSLLAQQP